MSSSNDLTLKSLILNSARRNLGSVQSAYYNINSDYPNVKAYKVSKMSFPNTVYNISERNDRLYCRLGTGGSVFTVNLEDQNYNGGTLATQLQSKLNAHTSSNLAWSVNYNTASNTLSFNNTSSSFLFSAGSSLIGPEANLWKYGYFECGLQNKLNTQQTSLTTDSIDLAGIKSLNIQANIGSVKTNNLYSNLLDTLPVNASFPELSVYLNESNDYYNVDNIQNIDFVKIELLDQYYREIDLKNDYSLQLNLLCD